MDLKAKFGTDPTIEVQGIDVHFGDDAYITIRRAGGANRAYETAITAAYAKNRHALEAKSMDKADADALMRNVYADAVVIGWRGIMVDGVALDFNRDNVLRLLTEVPYVFTVLQEEAQRLANFRSVATKELGNA